MRRWLLSLAGALTAPALTGCGAGPGAPPPAPFATPRRPAPYTVRVQGSGDSNVLAMYQAMTDDFNAAQADVKMSTESYKAVLGRPAYVERLAHSDSLPDELLDVQLLPGGKGSKTPHGVDAAFSRWTPQAARSYATECANGSAPAR